MNKPNITRIEFVNAPSVERPTSTKVNLDPAMLHSIYLAPYIAERRGALGVILRCLGNVCSINTSMGRVYTDADKLVAEVALVFSIDRVKFLNGDVALDRLLSMTDFALSMPDEDSIDLAYLQEYIDLFSICSGKRLYRLYGKTQVSAGKRAAQEHERIRRLMKKLKK